MGGPVHVRLARQLRNDATGCEQKLWRALRALRQQGFHIRRQVPIGPYVADFAGHAARLIIEVDGRQHDLEMDASRDAWFAKAGYRTLRVGNDAVLKEFDDVMCAVEKALGIERVEVGAGVPPPLTPPLKGEGE